MMWVPLLALQQCFLGKHYWTSHSRIARERPKRIGQTFREAL